MWTYVGQEFALRVLSTVYRLSPDLTDAEAAERDPDQLARLYRLDHAVTQIRRHVENLHVLAGRRVEDAGRQVTTLTDVIRAATSAIEAYPRVNVGHVVDLAVAEFAADDVIRVLTELIDNATRYSRPDTAVTVSAHLTDTGAVLLRVEDHGVGVEPGRLEFINRMLADDAPPLLRPDGAAHLGLVVVHRIARAHGLRVVLTARTPAGTTATVGLPSELLCEIPQQAAAPPEDQPINGAKTATTSGRARVPTALAAQAARTLGADGGLPQRHPSSLRATTSARGTREPASPPDERWADEIGSFAEGVDDANQRLSVTEGRP